MPSNNYDLRNVTLKKLKRETHCTTFNKARGRQKKKDEKGGRKKQRKKTFNFPNPSPLSKI